MTLWAEKDGFSYHYFDPFEDAPELQPFEQLISVWREKCQGRRVPAWSDFDFSDFLGWHSRIAIYDVSHDPFDYMVRLSGEQYNQIAGRNMKGMTRRGLLDITIEDEVSDKLYERASRELLFAFTKGTNIVDRQHINVEYLLLPLSDTEGLGTHSIEAVTVPVESKF